MPRGKRKLAEQIIPKLREVEVEVGRGKTRWRPGPREQQAGPPAENTEQPTASEKGWPKVDFLA